MSSTKRKLLETKLQRRVRPRRELSEELAELSDSPPPSIVRNENQGSEDEESSSEVEKQESDGAAQIDGNGSEVESSESDSDSDPEPEDAGSISFGALAKAQASLAGNKKGKSSKQGKIVGDGWEDNEAKERKAGRKDARDFNRSSKHAPTELSSKKAVSRRREVIPVPKRVHRDPRFEPVSGEIDAYKIRKAYSFLEDYREDEMKELRATIRKTKDEDERDRLKRQLISMENRKKAQDRKDKADEVVRAHKQEEKELVKAGKKPFYLKESEKRKRVLLDTYSGMKKGQLDHVIERRRRKLDQKEKKRLPFARRERS